ncbi:hypothetical protein EON63_00915 [archaeon]|nr:MAG: hypothetical protein EON63_00915 [archaeon]
MCHILHHTPYTIHHASYTITLRYSMFLASKSNKKEVWWIQRFFTMLWALPPICIDMCTYMCMLICTLMCMFKCTLMCLCMGMCDGMLVVYLLLSDHIIIFS